MESWSLTLYLSNFKKNIVAAGSGSYNILTVRASVKKTDYPGFHFYRDFTMSKI